MDEYNAEGFISLMVAVEVGNVGVVYALFIMGVDFNDGYAYGYRVFFIAVVGGSWDLFVVLL